ncbi:hypothetical protein BGZ68_002222 [Mortierella alpina]|nr:hypothetical protein BGZ68_002222 [Mortierella alpina]
MSQDFLAIPELVRLVSSYLSPPTLLNLVQVSRRWNQLFRELHTIRNWIRLIFKKYGHHIRVLKIRWDFVLEAASDAGVCTNLLTLELKLGKRNLWMNQPEHILQNPEAVGAASRARDKWDQGTASSGRKVLRALKNLPADLGIAYNHSGRLESDWVMLQNIWNMVTLNPALRRLIIKTKGGVFAEREPAKEYIDKTMKGLRHLKELRAGDFFGVDLLSRLQELAPQVESIWTSVKPDLEQGLSIPFNRNIKSLTVVNPSENPLSSTDVLTLLELHPNLEYLSVVDLRSNTRPDEEMGLKKVDAPALEAIQTYCKDIEVVKALYDPFYVKQNSQRRPIMDAVNSFLMSCPTLKVFDVTEHCIHADELILHPWACHGLETFRCRIVSFARLKKEQQTVYDRVSAPGYTAALTNAEAVVVRQFDQCRRQQHQVLDRLASLPNLKVLDLGYENRDPSAYQGELYNSYDEEYPDSYSFRGGSKFYMYGGPIADTLELSLDSGLERLAGLKHLEIFGFEGTDHRIGKRELNWIAKQWPRLRIMRGFAKDKLLYLKYDEKKAALREYMRSLRPDVEQSTLFKGFDE